MLITMAYTEERNAAASGIRRFILCFNEMLDEQKLFLPAHPKHQREVSNLPERVLRALLAQVTPTTSRLSTSTTLPPALI